MLVSQRMKGSYLRVEADSDFAGDLLNLARRHALFFGCHLLRASFDLQPTVILSSCEPEYYGCVWGVATREVATDSSAASGLASRRGVCKGRHVATHSFRLKERIAEKGKTSVSVPTDSYRARVLLSLRAPLETLMSLMGVEFRARRPAAQKGELLESPAPRLPPQA